MLDEGVLRERYGVGSRGEPRMRANMIASLDGAAHVGGRSGGLNDAEDTRLLGVLRGMADVVLVGAGTLRTEGYGGLRVGPAAVAWRRAHGMPDHPVLAVVSGRMGLGPEDAFLADAPVRPLVLTHGGAPADRRAALAGVADVVTCGDDAVDPRRVREVLVERGLPQMLTEGGPRLLGALAGADVLDELCLTLAPVIAGGDASRVVVGAPEVPREMRLVHALPGERMLFLRYAR